MSRNQKNANQYQLLENTWSCPINKTEYFFVTYALNGSIADPSIGTRYGIPTDYPLKNSPVTEPSPLNTRWKYNLPNKKLTGIL
jgi:hypothetical protein